jgi:DNA-directed RNA polymerase subunit beta'
MRPSTPGDDGEAKPDDVSELYKHVFATRKYGGKNAQLAYEQLVNNHNLDENSRNKKAGGYAAQSLYDRFGGKGGVFRKNLTGYTIPYSGRAVIVPTTSINYDEVKIPAAMAADIFKPTIQSNLERKGFSHEQIREILADAKKPQAEVAPITRNILQAAMEEENVRTLLIRQPTLHKASMQGFKPKISENATVQINPIIVGGYNADFDGDTMQVIAINTSDLTPTIDKTMHPSNFKYTPRAQEELNMKPTKDAKWGIMNVLKRRS